MHTSIAYLAVVLPVVLGRPQNVFPPDETPRYCPKVDNTAEDKGEPWQIGPSAKGGATLTITESHEIGTTWTKGGDIGLSVDQVIGVGGGFSAEVSKTVSDATAEGAEDSCDEGEWSCSMMVTPGVKRVEGHLEEMVGNDAGCDVDPLDHDGDFVVLIPLKSDAGNAKSSVSMCLCANLPHADDEGAPDLPKCKEDCVDPGE